MGSLLPALSGCQTVALKAEVAEESAAGELRLKRASFRGNKSILLQHPREKFPIAVSKLSEHEYSAILMKCSHQQCTTERLEDEIICPCHGATFSLTGELIKGPAKSNLQTFVTRIDANDLYILLG